jgi:hypothetical protein
MPSPEANAFPVRLASMRRPDRLRVATGAGHVSLGGVPPTGSHPKDPLHGVTLEALLTELVGHYGWTELGRRIDIRCFNFDPSIKSSLHFLRKTPWARTKVEELYRRCKAGG